MTKGRQFGSGAAWAMLDNLAQQVLSFLVFLVLARLVSPTDFGLIAIAHVMVTLVRSTVFDAVAHPVARAQEPTDLLYNRAFTMCILLAASLATAMLISAPTVARFYALPELKTVVMWMSLVVLATGTAAMYEARLVRQMLFKPLAIRSIVSVCIGGCVGLLMAFRGYGVIALVAQQVVTSCMALGLLVIQSAWKPRLVFKGLAPRAFLPDATRVSSTGLFNFATAQGDTLLVSVLMGSHATGIYNFAKRLTSAIYLVIGSSLLKLSISAFADAKNNPTELRAAYTRILATAIFLMAPLLAGISGLAEPVIALVFGPKWAPAAPVLAVLSCFYLLLAINQLNDYLLFAVGDRTMPARRGLVQILLVIALGSAFSGLGLVWTSAAFSFAALLVWPWVQKTANRHMQTNFMKWTQSMMNTILATASMLGALWLFERSSFDGPVWLAVKVGAGGIVFFTIYWLSTRLLAGVYDPMQELWNLLMRKRDKSSR